MRNSPLLLPGRVPVNSNVSTLSAQTDLSEEPTISPMSAAGMERSFQSGPLPGRPKDIKMSK